MPKAAKPTSGGADDRSVWRNPAWITAFAAAVVVLLGGLGTFIVKVRGSDEPQSSAPDRSTPATEVTVPQPTAPTDTGIEATSTTSESRTLAVAVSRGFETDTRAGETYLLPPGSIATSDVPPRQAGLYEYVVSHGGIPAGATNFGLTLSALGTQRITILSVVPRITSRTTPSTGVLLKNGFGCGSEPVRAAKIDFDIAPPAVQYTDGISMEPLPSLVLSVSTDDVEVLGVTARSTVDDVAFVMDVHYVEDGKEQVATVDDGGTPFRVTGAPPGTPVFRYSYETGAEAADNFDSDPYGYC